MLHNPMKWFLERISARSLPVSFGVRDGREHSEDFKLLVQKKIIKHVSNLDAVPCDFCEADDHHECQVRNDEGKLSYVCDNGHGTRALSSCELAIYDFDNGNWLQLLTNELGLSVDTGSHKDEAEYSDDTFFRLGTYEDKVRKFKADVYYLRDSGSVYEATLRFTGLGNQNKMLITNTVRAHLTSGKENLFTCVLEDILSSGKKDTLFDKKAFGACFDAVRRVRFDKKNGHLFLDGTRVYTAPLTGNHRPFLSYLWDKWMQQVPHSDIYQFVKGENDGKKSKDETSQKFCQKIKSEIKAKCKEIDNIITTPTSGHYMMADPLGEMAEK